MTFLSGTVAAHGDRRSLDFVSSLKLETRRIVSRTILPLVACFKGVFPPSSGGVHLLLRNGPFGISGLMEVRVSINRRSCALFRSARSRRPAIRAASRLRKRRDF